MRVLVTPRDSEGKPIPGAGSWIAQVCPVDTGYFDGETEAIYPRRWCEEIPEVVPEPGDICEFWDDDNVEDPADRYIGVFIKAGENGFYSQNYNHSFYWKDCRLIAKKPPAFSRELWEALLQLYNDWREGKKDCYTMYASLLSLILGGAGMGRVE